MLLAGAPVVNAGTIGLGTSATNVIPAGTVIAGTRPDLAPFGAGVWAIGHLYVPNITGITAAASITFVALRTDTGVQIGSGVVTNQGAGASADGIQNFDFLIPVGVEALSITAVTSVGTATIAAGSFFYAENFQSSE